MQYDKDRVYDIPMSEIFDDDDFNCRGTIDLMNVRELANDIKENGLTQPITLQPYDKKEGKKFRIVAGYRRFKAHLLNRAKTIRSLIREDLDEFSARVFNLSENVHRANLNIKQEAHALDPFRRAGWSEPYLAQRLQKSRGWVQVRFMLLALPDDVQNEAAAGLLSQQQIRDLHTTMQESGDEVMYQYIRKIKDAKLKGKTGEVELKKKIITNAKRERTRSEIFAIQEIVHKLLGASISTRLLGWAAGEVDDREIHEELASLAAERGKFYFVPPEFMAKAAPRETIV